MTIATRDFGEVEIQESDVITFASPIYGFEHLKKYVCLFDENNSYIIWLQSLEDPHICFVMVDPAAVDPAYRPAIPRETAELLGEGELLFWLIMVVAPDFRDSTVNMKSPVLINTETRRAAQAILEEDYPIRRPLAAKKRGGR